mgnify:CR=1 FL=1
MPSPIPVYKIQIVDLKGNLVSSHFGGPALERDLNAAVMEKLADTPLGYFTSRAKVEAAVQQAIADVCLDLRMSTKTALPRL